MEKQPSFIRRNATRNRKRDLEVHHKKQQQQQQQQKGSRIRTITSKTKTENYLNSLPEIHLNEFDAAARVSPGHSAKSAGGRLQLNTHTPYVCGFA